MQAAIEVVDQKGAARIEHMKQVDRQVEQAPDCPASTILSCVLPHQ
jgi:hypothetical protein